ncbi:MAG: putative oxidoreductase [Pseudonocardiales bacterium]|nr:putative oxidoreductase [Pseudonocardiales bacterium]
MNRRSAGWRAAVCAFAVVVLAGCASDTQSRGWTPKPDLPPAQAPDPGLPNQDPIPNPNITPSPGGTPTPGQTAPVDDPRVVAKNLASPIGLIMLADGTALVGERTTGRIVKVQPIAGQPVVPVMTIGGLDASGDGGLLDLALSPTYGQDGLVLAYITTPTDNRVVHFTVGGVATPVLSGIPKGATGNGGRISFDGAGNLLIATGTAGNPALAQDPASLAGKILRTDDLGHPIATNPTPTSPIWATGPASVTGLCINPVDGQAYVTATAPDAVYAVAAGAVLSGPSAAAPIAALPNTWPGAGGCAVGNLKLYVATLAGASLIGAPTVGADALTTYTAVLEKTYGRLRSVVYAPDGALWLTTANTEPGGTPGPDDERVIRIIDAAGGGGGDLV